VGGGTLAADDPQLTVRFGRKMNPARIVFSSGETLPRESYFVKNARTARSIAVIRGTTGRRIVADSQSGIEYWHTGAADPAESMAAFAEMAFAQNITSVLVEGGSKVASVLLEAGLVNRIYLFYGNQIIGDGICGIGFGRGLPIDGGITFMHRQTVLVGNDVYVTGVPVYPHRSGT
jgi:diaminohydroxyphosphoribosylaminopyrimidine deaminase/5-amino-6-(5-phosphoribosylamino)uracil reductase